MRRAIALSLACALAAALAGCGEGGMSKGATVSIYVTAPLCDGAKRELARSGGHAGSVRIRAVCLFDNGRRGVSVLAALGAGARRAVEDSTTVGYIGEPQPVATRFAHPILESAGIAWISSSSGTTAMARLLRAIRESGSGPLRESVREALGKT